MLSSNCVPSRSCMCSCTSPQVIPDSILGGHRKPKMCVFRRKSISFVVSPVLPVSQWKSSMRIRPWEYYLYREQNRTCIQIITIPVSGSELYLRIISVSRRTRIQENHSPIWIAIKIICTLRIIPTFRWAESLFGALAAEYIKPPEKFSLKSLNLLHLLCFASLFVISVTVLFCDCNRSLNKQLKMLKLQGGKVVFRLRGLFLKVERMDFCFVLRNGNKLQLQDAVQQTAWNISENF